MTNQGKICIVISFLLFLFLFSFQAILLLVWILSCVVSLYKLQLKKPKIYIFLTKAWKLSLGQLKAGRSFKTENSRQKHTLKQFSTHFAVRMSNSFGVVCCTNSFSQDFTSLHSVLCEGKSRLVILIRLILKSYFHFSNSYSIYNNFCFPMECCIWRSYLLT